MECARNAFFDPRAFCVMGFRSRFRHEQHIMFTTHYTTLNRVKVYSTEHILSESYLNLSNNVHLLKIYSRKVKPTDVTK